MNTKIEQLASLNKALKEKENTRIELLLKKELFFQKLNSLKKEKELQLEFKEHQERTEKELREIVNIKHEQADNIATCKTNMAGCEFPLILYSKQIVGGKRALFNEKKENLERKMLEEIDHLTNQNPRLMELKKKEIDLVELEKQLQNVRRERAEFEKRMVKKKKIMDISFKESIIEIAKHMVRYNSNANNIQSQEVVPNEDVQINETTKMEVSKLTKQNTSKVHESIGASVLMISSALPQQKIKNTKPNTEQSEPPALEPTRGSSFVSSGAYKQNSTFSHLKPNEDVMQSLEVTQNDDIHFEERTNTPEREVQSVKQKILDMAEGVHVPTTNISSFKKSKHIDRELQKTPSSNSLTHHTTQNVEMETSADECDIQMNEDKSKDTPMIKGKEKDNFTFVLDDDEISNWTSLERDAENPELQISDFNSTAFNVDNMEVESFRFGESDNELDLGTFDGQFGDSNANVDGFDQFNFSDMDMDGDNFLKK